MSHCSKEMASWNSATYIAVVLFGESKSIFIINFHEQQITIICPSLLRERWTQNNTVDFFFHLIMLLCGCDLRKRIWVIILPVSKNLNVFRLEIHGVKCVQIRSFSWSVFSPNAGKYGPEKNPYLDTFRLEIERLTSIHLKDQPFKYDLIISIKFDVLKIFTKMLTWNLKRILLTPN